MAAAPYFARKRGHIDAVALGTKASTHHVFLLAQHAGDPNAVERAKHVNKGLGIGLYRAQALEIVETRIRKRPLARRSNLHVRKNEAALRR